jgi:hypothetical protein
MPDPDDFRLHNNFPQAITARAAEQKFQCGDGYSNLTVINFKGPDGAKLSAFCCNMNVDADGEPQAYAPLGRADLKPRDGLGDAGWKSKEENEKLKTKWEAAVKTLEDLERQKAEIVAKQAAGPQSSPATARPPNTQQQPAPSLKEIDDKIKHVKADLTKNYYWREKESDRPANYGRIFWHWYGVVSLPKSKESLSWWESVADKKVLRRPVLDKDAIYEDVYGTFPVVQSQYEPGPGYFVSQLPGGVKNNRYPGWDQRYFLPDSQLTQGPFAALASGFQYVSGVQLGDTLFALRLDTAQTLAFPYRDSGYGWKVAECGYEAFAALGGQVPQLVNYSRNDFLLLYLAFPGRQTPETALTKFAKATNAEDFPVMLAFLAQATIDAKNHRTTNVSGDPLHSFQLWKKSGAPPRPQIYDTIETALRNNGFTPAAQRYLRRHPDPFLGKP